MGLKAGMYVRTESGIIEKINQIYDRHTTDNIVVWLNGYGDGKSVFIDDFEEIKFQSINSRGFIKKEPSFNSIDLIEVGDRIKYELSDIKGWLYIETSKDLELVKTDFKETDIKSIVTKEQFEEIKYEL